MRVSIFMIVLIAIGCSSPTKLRSGSSEKSRPNPEVTGSAAIEPKAQDIERSDPLDHSQLPEPAVVPVDKQQCLMQLPSICSACVDGIDAIFSSRGLGKADRCNFEYGMDPSVNGGRNLGMYAQGSATTEIAMQALREHHRDQVPLPRSALLQTCPCSCTSEVHKLNSSISAPYF